MTATPQTVITLKEGEARKNEGQQHHDGLRDQQQAALVDAVGNDSAKEREEQERDRSGEPDNAQPEGGVGEGENQPALGHVLHPGADVGEEIAAPEEAEIGVAQGADDLRQPLCGSRSGSKPDDRCGSLLQGEQSVGSSV